MMPIVDGDDDSIQTTAVIRSDGACARHPHILLREKRDGTTYQRESCPLCDKEFKQNKLKLKKQRGVLEQKLKDLEEKVSEIDDSYPGSTASSKGGKDSVRNGPKHIHIQEQQEICSQISSRSATSEHSIPPHPYGVYPGYTPGLMYPGYYAPNAYGTLPHVPHPASPITNGHTTAGGQVDHPSRPPRSGSLSSHNSYGMSPNPANAFLPGGNQDHFFSQVLQEQKDVLNRKDEECKQLRLKLDEQAAKFQAQSVQLALAQEKVKNHERLGKKLFGEIEEKAKKIHAQAVRLALVEGKFADQNSSDQKLQAKVKEQALTIQAQAVELALMKEKLTHQETRLDEERQLLRLEVDAAAQERVNEKVKEIQNRWLEEQKLLQSQQQAKKDLKAVSEAFVDGGNVQKEEKSNMNQPKKNTEQGTFTMQNSEQDLLQPPEPEDKKVALATDDPSVELGDSVHQAEGSDMDKPTKSTAQVAPGQKRWLEQNRLRMSREQEKPDTTTDQPLNAGDDVQTEDSKSNQPINPDIDDVQAAKTIPIPEPVEASSVNCEGGSHCHRKNVKQHGVDGVLDSLSCPSSPETIKETSTNLPEGEKSIVSVEGQKEINNGNVSNAVTRTSNARRWNDSFAKTSHHLSDTDSTQETISVRSDVSSLSMSRPNRVAEDTASHEDSNGSTDSEHYDEFDPDAAPWDSPQVDGTTSETDPQNKVVRDEPSAKKSCSNIDSSLKSFGKPKRSGSMVSVDSLDSLGHSIESSTYGEDRVKVVNQVLSDPYGDQGTYTGVVLRSTGMPHGSGRMRYGEIGRSFDGEWAHGRWHGYGQATFSNGDSYAGNYRSDQRHGHGIYHWRDGRVFDGTFYEDQRHGKGKYSWPDGSSYSGNFVHGQRDGYGIYKFSDGGHYEGYWKNGRYHGYGTCTWADGRQYKGEWSHGKANGKGTETYADGTLRHNGEWVDDQPVKVERGFHETKELIVI